ncbi:short chain dehydrogenase [Legionella massiliensis]|uniref:Short chain dehydrogenase n=1 Tax=Legionella massiliensis TaxID=1034943 RepID=A0A078KVV3_9GAMM|nr:SDR family NAD(P)-dependent oxidoreductase [Legionella massiliensis]CDZ78555.1 short chain dehydrogenase [Legionella massiliensis]CEE14293.1 short chain dehydrogenase [Legionella massiliensis]
MTSRTWVILGATSIIAEEFAKLAAQAGYSLLLVGRHKEQLAVIAADLGLRYKIECAVQQIDFSGDLKRLLTLLQTSPNEIDLFIAFSSIIENFDLDEQNIEQLLRVNTIATVQIINNYIHRSQSQHRMIFLSSVAACRGRAKNSLYGGSKALIETYLQGLQQASQGQLQITIARLGFIDTTQTFGLPGIFYASPPEACAKACWRASYAGKRFIYHPFFWRYIMAIISRLPFFIYKKMKI